MPSPDIATRLRRILDHTEDIPAGATREAIRKEVRAALVTVEQSRTATQHDGRKFKLIPND